MKGQFNRGKKLEFQWIYQGLALPANFYLALVTATTPPDPDHNTLSQLEEIDAGNGYTAGGYVLDLNTTDFDSITQDNSADLARQTIKDVTFTATGGPLPASGDPARYAVLTTDEGTIGNRQLLWYWDLGADQSRLIGQTLTIQDLTMRRLDP